MLIHFSHNTFTIKWHLTDRTDNRLQFQADHSPRLFTKNRTDIDFKKLCSFSYFTPNFILGYGFVPTDFFSSQTVIKLSMISPDAGCPHPPPIDPPVKARKSVWLETTAIKSTVTTRTNIHIINDYPSLTVFSPTFRHIFSNKPLGSVI